VEKEAITTIIEKNVTTNQSELMRASRRREKKIMSEITDESITLNITFSILSQCKFLPPIIFLIALMEVEYQNLLIIIKWGSLIFGLSIYRHQNFFLSIL
jgi:hypothetical protein